MPSLAKKQILLIIPEYKAACLTLSFGIVQAYQNSAYNHGQEPYRGSAGEIPEPPPPTYGGSRGGSAGHRQTKPPLPPRYKSELKVGAILILSHEMKDKKVNYPGNP